MRDFLSKVNIFYTAYKVKIWAIIAAIIIVLVAIRIMDNQAGKNLKKKAEEINEKYNLSVNKNNIKNIDEDFNDDCEDVIEEFLDCCIEKDTSDAYSMLSEGCRDNLYPSEEYFENNYINKLFNGVEEYEIELYAYMLDENMATYKVYLSENSLENGGKNFGKEQKDFITVYEKEYDYYLSVGGFIYNQILKNSVEKNNIQINLVSHTVYSDKEVFEINIYNKNNNDINLDEFEIYSLDEINAERKFKVSENRNIIKPKERKDIILELDYLYNGSLNIKEIIFKKEKEDIINIEIN